MFKVNNNLYLTLKFIKVGLYSEGLTVGMLIVIFARGGGERIFGWGAYIRGTY